MKSGDRKIPFANLLVRSDWGRSGEPALAFKILDSDSVRGSIARVATDCGNRYVYSAHLLDVIPQSSECAGLEESLAARAEKLPTANLPSFAFRYPTTMPPGEIWSSIAIP